MGIKKHYSRSENCKALASTDVDDLTEQFANLTLYSTPPTQEQLLAFVEKQFVVDCHTLEPKAVLQKYNISESEAQDKLEALTNRHFTSTPVRNKSQVKRKSRSPKRRHSPKRKSKSPKRNSRKRKSKSPNKGTTRKLAKQ